MLVAPQQSAFAMRLYGIAHKVEPTIGVNNLYDGHRTHEEEQRFGRFAQMFSQAFAHMRQYASSITCQFGHARQNEFGWVNHEKRPANHTHQERHRRLVHLRQAFEGYAKIAHNEDNDDCQCQ